MTNRNFADITYFQSWVDSRFPIGRLSDGMLLTEHSSNIRPAPRPGSACRHISNTNKPPPQSAADQFSMQETWNAGVQIVFKGHRPVVASKMVVAIFTRRAKTVSHWMRQRQLKRDSVFHLLDEMSQDSKKHGLIV